jgi:hypothetical protein
MKGGKAGQGRKPTVKRAADPAASRGPKRGAPKKDWGAVPNEREKPSGLPGKRRQGPK